MEYCQSQKTLLWIIQILLCSQLYMFFHLFVVVKVMIIVMVIVLFYETD